MIDELEQLNTKARKASVDENKYHVDDIEVKLNLESHNARIVQLLDDFLQLTHNSEEHNEWSKAFSTIKKKVLGNKMPLDDKWDAITDYTNKIKGLEAAIQAFHKNYSYTDNIQETASTSDSHSEKSKIIETERPRKSTKREESAKTDNMSKWHIDLRKAQISRWNHVKDWIKNSRGKDIRPHRADRVNTIISGINQELKTIRQILNQNKLSQQEKYETSQAITSDINGLREKYTQFTEHGKHQGKSFRKTYEQNLQKQLDNLKTKRADLTKKALDVRSEAHTIEKNKPNQDAYSCNQEHRIYAVFDGMGGYAGGNIASNIAKNHLESNLDKLADDIPLYKAKFEMEAMLTQFHKEIQAKQKDEKFKEMGSTASVVKIRKNGIALIGNIGDSRVYCFNAESKSVEHLTLDDSQYTYEKLKQGVSRDSLLEHQRDIANIESIEDLPNNIPFEAFTNRHMLSQALGHEEHDFIPHISIHQLLPGDRLIITSDGIHDNLKDQEIIECLSQNPFDTKKAAQALVQRAKEVSQQKTTRSKPDDTTAIVVDL